MKTIDQIIKDCRSEGTIEYSIGDLITRVNEKGKKHPNIKTVYSVSNTLGIIRSDDFRENAVYSQDTSNYVVIEPRMFAYNPARLNIGSIAFLKGNEAGLVSPMYVVFKVNENIIIDEYLFYLLKTTFISKRIKDYTEEGARFRFDFERWNWIKINVPSIEKQKEIVNALDLFTQLEAELEARKKQYQLYREQLLNFDEETNGGGRKLMFSDLLNYIQPTRFIVGSTQYDDSYSIPVLTAGKTFILGYTNEQVGIYNASKDNPVIIFDDFTCSIQWVDFPFKVKSSAMKILNKKYDDLNLKFLYYLMKKIDYKPAKGEHSRQWLSSYSKKEVFIPDRETQDKITLLLDYFDDYINDLSSGLPKEIKLRKQQYEYYRDILLNFEGA